MRFVIGAMALATAAPSNAQQVLARPTVRVPIVTPQLREGFAPHPSSPAERSNAVRSLTGKPMANTSGATLHFATLAPPASGMLTLWNVAGLNIGGKLATLTGEGVVRIIFADTPYKGAALVECGVDQGGEEGASWLEWLIRGQHSKMVGAAAPVVNGKAMFVIDFAQSPGVEFRLQNTNKGDWNFAYCDVTRIAG